MAHVDLAVDVEDRAVGREERRLEVGAVALVEADLLPDVLLEELLG
jgi:hypothetical protein